MGPMVPVGTDRRPPREIFDDCLLRIKFGNEEEQLAATRKARKLLSKEDNPPGRAAVDSGLVPIMVEMLKSKNAKLVFEAAWTLTNVASTDCTAELAYDQPPLRRNAIPLLVQLLRHPNKDVREQCSWCLGNVAGDGVALRDIVLSTPNAQIGRASCRERV